MRTKSKALLMALCAIMLVVTSVVGTMAYLTDEDEVTNIFTIGKVTLGDGEEDGEAGLDEAKVNEYGEPVDEQGNKVDDISDAPRVDGNSYKLVPGHDYAKDPTVHVRKDSENSFIFVKVENGIEDIEADDDTIAAQMTDNGWLPLNGVDNVFYKEWTKMSETETTETDDLIVFEHFQIDGAVTNDDLNDAQKNYADAEIVVTAYAVQKDGFDDAKAAWVATFGAPTTP